jgi:hypothetical protein
MEIVGGFMVMMSILTLFLAVVWLIMPFVVFAIKGKQDRTLEVLESIEKRMTSLEAALHRPEPENGKGGPAGYCDISVVQSNALLPENSVIPPESAAGKNGPDASPAV